MPMIYQAMVLRVLIVVACMGLAGGGLADTLSAPNEKRPMPQLITAGQPTEGDLAVLKSEGVDTVINLRGPNEELPFAEQAVVEALGLEYVHIPIAGASGLTRENAQQLHELLAGDETVFLHCASGNRAGALMALREHYFNGATVEEALAIGRASGLSSLEPAVKAVLHESLSNSPPDGHEAQK